MNTYNTKLQNNNTNLSSILNTINSLPEAGSGGGSSIEDAFVTRSITEYTNNRVTEIGNSALAHCQSLTSVNLLNVTHLGGSAISYCTKLTNVNIPKLASTDTGAFRGCSKLTSVDFPSLITVGSYMVADCPLIVHLDFPLVTEVLNNAFAGCRGLVSINFAKKIDITSYVFNNCTSLEAVIMRGAEMSTLSHPQTFAGSKVAAGTGYIYVPAALVDTYKSATNWSNYASQFRAIEDYPDITGG